MGASSLDCKEWLFFPKINQMKENKCNVISYEDEMKEKKRKGYHNIYALNSEQYYNEVAYNDFHAIP